MASGVSIARGFLRNKSLFRTLQSCERCFSTLKYKDVIFPCHLANSFKCQPSTLKDYLPSSQVNLKLSTHQGRHCSTATDQNAKNDEPYSLVEPELRTLFQNIRKALACSCAELQDIAAYHFDGQGKAIRPMIVMLMARAVNKHTLITPGPILSTQRQIAEIAEMIHTASLIHDDVIDTADTRRSRPSVQSKWGQRKAIIAGDYVIAISSILLARIRNEEVVEILAKVLEDLVRGEFMQLGSKENENERFSHYLRKSYKKTASLIANSCKAVAVLGQCQEELIEAAYQYGRNTGIAFQLVDDLLDFVSSEAEMGKPTAADLRLGLATAPVLFAAQEHPDLHALIMRRFSQPGDVEYTWHLVQKSDGVAQTRFMAEKHCLEAVSQIKKFAASPERDALITVTHKILNRLK